MECIFVISSRSHVSPVTVASVNRCCLYLVSLWSFPPNPSPPGLAGDSVELGRSRLLSLCLCLCVLACNQVVNSNRGYNHSLFLSSGPPLPGQLFVDGFIITGLFK